MFKNVSQYVCQTYFPENLCPNMFSPIYWIHYKIFSPISMSERTANEPTVLLWWRVMPILWCQWCSPCLVLVFKSKIEILIFGITFSYYIYNIYTYATKQACNKHWDSTTSTSTTIYIIIYFIHLHIHTFLDRQLVSIHHFICPTGSFIWPWPQSAGAQKWMSKNNRNHNTAISNLLYIVRKSRCIWFLI